MNAYKNVMALVGRLFIGFIFVGSGFLKFSSMGATIGMMSKMMAPIPVGLIPMLAYAAALLELIGGLFVMIGFRARLSAFLLFLFLLPATYFFHVVPHDQINTMKNIAIMGGLLILAAQGPGRLSFD